MALDVLLVALIKVQELAHLLPVLAITENLLLSLVEVLHCLMLSIIAVTAAPKEQCVVHNHEHKKTNLKYPPVEEL